MISYDLMGADLLTFFAPLSVMHYLAFDYTGYTFHSLFRYGFFSYGPYAILSYCIFRSWGRLYTCDRVLYTYDRVLNACPVDSSLHGMGLGPRTRSWGRLYIYDRLLRVPADTCVCCTRICCTCISLWLYLVPVVEFTGEIIDPCTSSVYPLVLDCVYPAIESLFIQATPYHLTSFPSHMHSQLPGSCSRFLKHDYSTAFLLIAMLLLGSLNTILSSMLYPLAHIYLHLLGSCSRLLGHDYSTAFLSIVMPLLGGVNSILSLTIYPLEPLVSPVNDFISQDIHALLFTFLSEHLCCCLPFPGSCSYVLYVHTYVRSCVLITIIMALIFISLLFLGGVYTTWSLMTHPLQQILSIAYFIVFFMFFRLPHLIFAGFTLSSHWFDRQWFTGEFRPELFDPLVSPLDLFLLVITLYSLFDFVIISLDPSSLILALFALHHLISSCGLLLCLVDLLIIRLRFIWPLPVSDEGVDALDHWGGGLFMISYILSFMISYRWYLPYIMYHTNALALAYYTLGFRMGLYICICEISWYMHYHGSIILFHLIGILCFHMYDLVSLSPSLVQVLSLTYRPDTLAGSMHIYICLSTHLDMRCFHLYFTVCLCCCMNWNTV